MFFVCVHALQIARQLSKTLPEQQLTGMCTAGPHHYIFLGCFSSSVAVQMRASYHGLGSV